MFGDDLANHQVYSLKMTFWKQELDMLKATYDIWRSSSLTEYEFDMLDLVQSRNLAFRRAGIRC